MSTWDSIKTTLGTIAPVLGTALGGPLGGVAATTLSAILLGKSDGTEEEISAALSNITPEILSKLKQAEFLFEAQKLEIEARDRANAREREVKFMEAGEKDPIPPFLAIVIVSGFFAALFSSMFLPLTPNAKAIVDIMFGCMISQVGTVYQYYFGSSSGSLKKTTMINESSGLIGSLIKKISG